MARAGVRAMLPPTARVRARAMPPLNADTIVVVMLCRHEESASVYLLSICNF